MNRRAYPSDVSDAEWALVLPYLSLTPLDASQRKYDLREVFNALRWLVRTGAQWAYLPHDFPPPEIVQAQAWVVTAASEQERAQVGALSRQVQEVSGGQVGDDPLWDRPAAVHPGDDPLSGRCKHRAPGGRSPVGTGRGPCTRGSVGWPGCRVFAGWRGIMSGGCKPCTAGPGWPSPF